MGTNIKDIQNLIKKNDKSCFVIWNVLKVSRDYYSEIFRKNFCYCTLINVNVTRLVDSEKTQLAYNLIDT